jgi:hypothetical protein
MFGKKEAPIHADGNTIERESRMLEKNMQEWTRFLRSMRKAAGSDLTDDEIRFMAESFTDALEKKYDGESALKIASLARERILASR